MAQWRVGREVNAPCFGMGMFEKVVKGGGVWLGKLGAVVSLNTAHTRVWLFACHCDPGKKVGWRYRASTFTDCLSVTY